MTSILPNPMDISLCSSYTPSQKYLTAWATLLIFLLSHSHSALTSAAFPPAEASRDCGASPNFIFILHACFLSPPHSIQQHAESLPPPKNMLILSASLPLHNHPSSSSHQYPHLNCILNCLSAPTLAPTVYSQPSIQRDFFLSPSQISCYCASWLPMAPHYQSKLPSLYHSPFLTAHSHLVPLSLLFTGL